MKRRTRKTSAWSPVLLSLTVLLSAVLTACQLAGKGEEPDHSVSSTDTSSSSFSPSLSSDSSSWESALSSEGEPPQTPVFPYGYDRLNEAQRELYDLLESGTITLDTPYTFEKPIPIMTPAATELYQGLSLYQEHHSTGVWRENGYFFVSNEEGTEFVGLGCDRQFDNRGRDQEMALAFDQAEQEILARLPSKDAPELEKAQAIARLLAETVEYYDIAVYPPTDRPLTPEETELSRYASSEYGALVNHKAICTGYTAAFQYLADALGLHCLSIHGDAGGDSHAWNLLWLEGHWYHVDVTWMDQEERGINWKWFLCSDAEISLTHTNIHWSSSVGLDQYPLFDLPAADTPWPDRERLEGAA